MSHPPQQSFGYYYHSNTPATASSSGQDTNLQPLPTHTEPPSSPWKYDAYPYLPPPSSTNSSMPPGYYNPQQLTPPVPAAQATYQRYNTLSPGEQPVNLFDSAPPPVYEQVQNNPGLNLPQTGNISPSYPHSLELPLEQRHSYNGHPVVTPQTAYSYTPTPHSQPLPQLTQSPYSPYSSYPFTHPSPSHAFATTSLNAYPFPVAATSGSTPANPSLPTITRQGSVSSASTEAPLTGNSIGGPSLTERQQAEEAAYLAKKDTKERPPTHIIDRERKSIDWKSLRHKGTTTEVIEELMRMSTKNLKNPNDAPKRPMNAFMIYMSIRRPQIAKSNPKNVNGENSRILAREWSWYMPESEKQYWLDLSEDYRDEFKRRFPSFQYRKMTEAKKRPHSDPGSDDDDRRSRPAAWRAHTSHEAVGTKWSGQPSTSLAETTPRSMRNLPIRAEGSRQERIEEREELGSEQEIRGWGPEGYPYSSYGRGYDYPPQA